MKAVIQRVKDARLSVAGKLISEIGVGLCVYLGIEKGDCKENIEKLAKKIVNLRIIEDDNGKMNFSVLSKNLDILLISQFTLCADLSSGNRPSFTGAEHPSVAEKLYLDFASVLMSYGITVKTGVFGADMTIEQTNDGPVTIVVQSCM